MKVQFLYDTQHGHSRKIAKKLSIHAEQVDSETLVDSEIVVFVCPTYGDEELPLLMEDFIFNLKTQNKKYVVCELGNYYGFEEFEFGASKIIESELKKLQWRQFYPTLSLDSLPKIDWDTFNAWETGLKNALSNCC